MSSGLRLRLGFDMALTIKFGIRAVDGPGPDQDFARGGGDGQLPGVVATSFICWRQR
jgi:hypothetical protein